MKEFRTKSERGEAVISPRTGKPIQFAVVQKGSKRSLPKNLREVSLPPTIIGHSLKHKILELVGIPRGHKATPKNTTRVSVRVGEKGKTIQKSEALRDRRLGEFVSRLNKLGSVYLVGSLADKGVGRDVDVVIYPSSDKNFGEVERIMGTLRNAREDDNGYGYVLDFRKFTLDLNIRPFGAYRVVRKV